MFGEDVSAKFSSLLDTVNKGMAGMQLGEEGGGEGERGLFGGLLGAAVNAVMTAVSRVWGEKGERGLLHSKSNMLCSCTHAASSKHTSAHAHWHHQGLLEHGCFSAKVPWSL
jgi:hypothetical protein